MAERWQVLPGAQLFTGPRRIDVILRHCETEEFRVQLYCTRSSKGRTRYIYNPGEWLMTDWWLTVDWLMTDWWLTDDWLMTDWWLTDDWRIWLTTDSYDWLTADSWLTDNRVMSVWWLTDDCMMTDWWLTDDWCLTVDLLMTDWWQADDWLMTDWWLTDVWLNQWLITDWNAGTSCHSLAANHPPKNRPPHLYDLEDRSATDP